MASRREKLEVMLLAAPDDQLVRYMLAMETDREGATDRSLELDRKSTRLNSSHIPLSRMPSSA